MSSLATWLKGFAAAILGGAVSSLAQAAAVGSLQGNQLKSAAIVGAALTASAYLTKSPIDTK